MLQIPGHGHGMQISRDVNWGLRITLYLSNIDCLVYVFSVCQQELFCPILTTNSTNNRCHGQVPGPLNFYLLIFGAYNMYLLTYDLNPPSLHRQSLACSRHPPPKSVPVYLWLGSSREELFTRNRKTEIFHNNKLRTPRPQFLLSRVDLRYKISLHSRHPPTPKLYHPLPSVLASMCFN